MDFEEAKQIKSYLEADPEISALMKAPAPGPNKSEDGAALGLGYPLGEGLIPPPAPGVFLGLAMINSPLLGRPDEIAEVDAYRALLVVMDGRTALQPIMAIDVRLEALERHKPWAEESTEKMGLYMEKEDKLLRESWGAFDEQAFAVAAQFGEVGSGEICEVLATVLRDARAAMGMIRAAPGPKKKAPGPDDTMPNGSQSSKRLAGLWESLRNLFRGRFRLSPSA